MAYLELMEILPGERGRGVAAALAGELHRAADDSGVEVTLLHYEQGQPAVRAVLAPAGVPAALDLLGGQAGQHPALSGEAGPVPG